MTILLADKRRQIRSALRLLIEQETDLIVIGEADHVAQLMQLLEVTRPNLVLLDWQLAGIDSTAFIAQIKSSFPHTAIIALSSKPEAMAAALEAGAAAFIGKSESPQSVLAIIRLVCRQAGLLQAEQ